MENIENNKTVDNGFVAKINTIESEVKQEKSITDKKAAVLNEAKELVAEGVESSFHIDSNSFRKMMKAAAKFTKKDKDDIRNDVRKYMRAVKFQVKDKKFIVESTNGYSASKLESPIKFSDNAKDASGVLLLDDIVGVEKNLSYHDMKIIFTKNGIIFDGKELRPCRKLRNSFRQGEDFPTMDVIYPKKENTLRISRENLVATLDCIAVQKISGMLTMQYAPHNQYNYGLYFTANAAHGAEIKFSIPCAPIDCKYKNIVMKVQAKFLKDMANSIPTRNIDLQFGDELEAINHYHKLMNLLFVAHGNSFSYDRNYVEAEFVYNTTILKMEKKESAPVIEKEEAQDKVAVAS